MYTENVYFAKDLMTIAPGFLMKKTSEKELSD